MVGEDGGSLVAISDLHVGYADNRGIVDELRPESPQDWLLVAGDVGETVSHIERTLAQLRERFARVIWVPGNHELWTPATDPVTLRGEERYRHLVDLCRQLDVVTPENPYEIWRGPDGPVRIVPLFLGYDYTFLPDGMDRAAALAEAHRTGIVCTDEYLLHPDPFPSRQAWCEARLAQTRARLDALDPMPTVLVNHYPLVREPTRILRYPIFAQWCGTTATADWHLRYRAAVVVYGHLHIPRTSVHDGVRFEEVSLGYPREWKRRPNPPRLRQILPTPPGDLPEWPAIQPLR
ncbi:metallophosphoesterase family protein [Micromonospora sagamiensis]|uniref:3',5'-cyclic AMP phosphodiesterase CpdA n=1 Tax=Micromonospora sagamiensis TaxID=47875 RepID=A0A562WGL0_9ACTN|nr:metallophosphoesterase [Micromonospora sagamiensis]TWJ29315.1 3',5'-cyclic AMP phosphodiesterase CpdA [Micromonospora sagamiensis]BCL17658.1 metallophosphoesterase [Micromonospora sagamiensis]